MTQPANHAGSPCVSREQRHCCDSDRLAFLSTPIRRASCAPHYPHKRIAALIGLTVLALLLACFWSVQTATAQTGPEPVATPIPDPGDVVTQPVAPDIQNGTPGDTLSVTATPIADTSDAGDVPASPSAPGELALPDMQPAAVAAGESPCSGIPTTPNTTYGTAQTMTNRYYIISISQPSRVFMTMTNATGQLQFRTPRTGACPGGTTTLIDYQPVAGGVASVRYFNVTPGKYFARIATTTPGNNRFTFRWSVAPGYAFGEPNNIACAPSVIQPNINYLAFPENSRPDLDRGSGVGAENDFYRFTLGRQTLVTIQFSGYNAGQRQVQLRRGACASTALVDSTSYIANAAAGTIQRTLPAGTYWVRFITLNGTQSRTLYTLRVSTSSYSPRIDTCNPSGQPACERQTGGRATIYWWGMTGGTSLVLRLNGQSISGGTCGSQAQGRVYGPVTINNPPAAGSYTFNNVPPGYYAASAQWSPPRPGDGSTGDSKPLKMDCTLLADVQSLEPTPTPIPEAGEPSVPPTAPPDAAPRQAPTPVP